MLSPRVDDLPLVSEIKPDYTRTETGTLSLVLHSTRCKRFHQAYKSMSENLLPMEHPCAHNDVTINERQPFITRQSRTLVSREHVETTLGDIRLVLILLHIFQEAQANSTYLPLFICLQKLFAYHSNIFLCVVSKISVY